MTQIVAEATCEHGLGPLCGYCSGVVAKFIELEYLSEAYRQGPPPPGHRRLTPDLAHALGEASEAGGASRATIIMAATARTRPKARTKARSGASSSSQAPAAQVPAGGVQAASKKGKHSSFPAKWPGLCAVCRQPFEAGALIRRAEAEGGWRGAECC